MQNIPQIDFVNVFMRMEIHASHLLDLENTNSSGGKTPKLNITMLANYLANY